MGELVALRDARERTIAALSEHFAPDRLDVDEFERRVSLAHMAESPAELAKLTDDLPATEGAPQPRTALVPAAQVRESQTLLAILGGSEPRGRWIAPRHLKVVNIIGGSSLDFREAQLPAGVTEVSVFALMGGAEIIVPPGLAVEVGGHAIMGGFDHMQRTPGAPDPDSPLLRIHGFAMMGGVSVETRLPGESERDARRRRRRERRELRRENRRQLPERR